MNLQTALARVIETGDFTGDLRPTIHAIQNSRELFDIYRLNYECHRAKDGSWVPADGLWISHPQFDHIPETTILVADFEGEIVGTATVTLDGPRGVPLDQDSVPTGATTRAQGRRLAQVWRLLVKDSWPLKAPVLTALVTAATDHLLAKGVQTAFFLAQPADAECCSTLLNAVTLMTLQSARGLSRTRSILMRADVENLKCVLQKAVC